MVLLVLSVGARRATTFLGRRRSLGAVPGLGGPPPTQKSGRAAPADGENERVSLARCASRERTVIARESVAV